MNLLIGGNMHFLRKFLVFYLPILSVATFSVIFSQDAIITLSTIDSENLEINLINSESVGGFQFDITGVDILEAGGGLAEENGFMISIGGGTVLGFSLTGNSISPGSGVLLNLNYSEFNLFKYKFGL